MRRLSETMLGMNRGRRHDRLGSEEDMIDPRKGGKGLAKLTFDVSKKPFRMSSGVSIFKKTDTYVRIHSSYTTKPNIKSVILKRMSDVETLSKRITAGSKGQKESIEVFFMQDMKGMSLKEQGYQVEAFLEHLANVQSMNCRLILLEWLKLDEYKETASPGSPGSKENVCGQEKGGPPRSSGSSSSALDINDIDVNTAC